jgi:alpha-tubulin suppressor-like RCC1 family protein
MKKTPRASRVVLGAAIVLAGSAAALACWPLAPSGGDLSEDAAVAPVPDATNVTGEDGSTSASGDGGAEGGTTQDGATLDGSRPVLPHPSTTIAEGIGFACAIDGQGNVWCWGNNTFGQTGAPLTVPYAAQPVMVAGVSSATAIALGDYHACAVTASNAVYCWGINNSGQLAHDPDAGVNDDICPGAVAQQNVACNPTAVQAAVPAAIGVAAAGGWTCTVGTDGTVECWGAIQTGATVSGAIGCGTGTAQMGGMCYPAPYSPGLNGVTQLAVAFDHACAVSGEDGGSLVTCWGNNEEGQVYPSASCLTGCGPELPALPAALSVAAGTDFTCAIVADGGTVSCFGDNQYGELGQTPPAGDASGTYNSNPTTVAGLGAVAELVAAGNEAACAIVDGGVVECWGNVAAAASPGAPVAIPGLPPLNTIGVPDNSYACGVQGDGGVWCWNLLDGGSSVFVPWPDGG